LVVTPNTAFLVTLITVLARIFTPGVLRWIVGSLAYSQIQLLGYGDLLLNVAPNPFHWGLHNPAQAFNLCNGIYHCKCGSIVVNNNDFNALFACRHWISNY
jgi:hypothetical protein